MLTDQYGNRGIDRHGVKSTDPPDGILQQDEIDIRRQGTVASFGVPIHTQKQEGTGMPNIQHPMWYSSELQNKCDTNSIETCSANANCMINDKLYHKS